MKQETLIELAADKFANIRYNPYASPTGNMLAKNIACKVGFRQGVEWQRNHVWHKISEIPKQGEHILVRFHSGNFTSWYVPTDIQEIFRTFMVDSWAYIGDISPASFDEILDQNKDVLQRLKDK